jgi:hypothetical protein
MRLVELFCHVDDFCQPFHPKGAHQLLASGQKTRRRRGKLGLSELMTIVIHFHQSNYRTFKAFYQDHVQVHLCGEFPNLVSYERFVSLLPRTIGPLSPYSHSLFGQCSGISFVDSTPLAVCHTRRIPRHRVFAGLAARGKTSMGWFYGFKLHLVVNDQGELLAVQITPGNFDDRRSVPTLAKRLWGKLFGDRGYISKKLIDQLWQDYDLQLITNLRKNMKNRLIEMHDKVLLRKWAIIETIIDQLKNISQIQHSRHRNPANFVVNLLAGLIAYAYQPKKPNLNLAPSSLAPTHP